MTSGAIKAAIIGAIFRNIWTNDTTSAIPGSAGLASSAERFQNGSMNITLKNVPPNVHKALKRAAKEEGRTLNAHIIHKP
jgi:hypothetical protein